MRVGYLVMHRDIRLRLPSSRSPPGLDAEVLEHLSRPCLGVLQVGHDVPVPPRTKQRLLSEILSGLLAPGEHVRLTLKPPPRFVEERVETCLVPRLVHSCFLSPPVT